MPAFITCSHCSLPFTLLAALLWPGLSHPLHGKHFFPVSIHYGWGCTLIKVVQCVPWLCSEMLLPGIWILVNSGDTNQQKLVRFSCCGQMPGGKIALNCQWTPCPCTCVWAMQSQCEITRQEQRLSKGATVPTVHGPWEGTKVEELTSSIFELWEVETSCFPSQF